MSTNQNSEDKIPFSSTTSYHREKCKECVCSTCYEQEFCDRCSTCTDLSRKKESCNGYEGAYSY